MCGVGPDLRQEAEVRLLVVAVVAEPAHEGVPGLRPRSRKVRARGGGRWWRWGPRVLVPAPTITSVHNRPLALVLWPLLDTAGTSLTRGGVRCGGTINGTVHQQRHTPLDSKSTEASRGVHLRGARRHGARHELVAAARDNLAQERHGSVVPASHPPPTGQRDTRRNAAATRHGEEHSTHIKQRENTDNNSNSQQPTRITRS